jgi:GNAT superfamily N-acetyltransferase
VAHLRSLAAAAYLPYVPRVGRPPAPLSADYAAIVARGEASVAVRADQIIGMIVLVAQADHLLLENVAVLPAEQGQGVGTRLLEFADARARELGLPAIRLYTNEAMTENLAYYLRHGYVETHRAVEHGLRRVYFIKQQLSARQHLGQGGFDHGERPGDLAD